MRFRTGIEINNFSPSIEHNEGLMTIGSCFADHISNKLSEYRFNITANPFGVLYNPASVYFSIKLLKNKNPLNRTDLINFRDNWHSFYHHSSFSGPDEHTMLQKINKIMELTRIFLQRCGYLFITYGSSYFYTYNKSGQIVSNCHKIPAAEFTLERLSVDQVHEYAAQTVELIHHFNPGCRIIFTVSPVRYLKYGFTGNQLSKATLLLGVDKLIKSDLSCSYFPAYEMLIDDLRDYRFYAADLVQPGEQAIQYIWEKFIESYISDHCRKAMAEIEPINKARLHRPFNPDSKERQSFLQKQLVYLDRVSESIPYVNWQNDRNFFKSQILKKNETAGDSKNTEKK